jgi:hypothetical protein
VEFLHNLRNGKVGAVVDIPHDGIDPFNFFHLNLLNSIIF